MAAKRNSRRSAHDEYIRERVAAGRHLEYIGALLVVALVLISFRNPFLILLGSVVAVIVTAFAFYSYKKPRNKYVKMRARYILLFVVLSVFAYFASHGIPRNDTALMTAVAGALVTATSISAVFAASIYEKMKEVTIRNKATLPQELIDLVVRLAIYPMLISVIALFASISALLFSTSNFIFSVILINLAITAVLLALLVSIELLKEDLLRQLD